MMHKHDRLIILLLSIGDSSIDKRTNGNQSCLYPLHYYLPVAFVMLLLRERHHVTSSIVHCSPTTRRHLSSSLSHCTASGRHITCYGCHRRRVSSTPTPMRALACTSNQ